MKAYLNLIVFASWLILVADAVICVFKPNPITIASAVISTTVFVAAFVLYVRERRRRK